MSGILNPTKFVIEPIKTGVIDTQGEISPDFKLIQLVQSFQTREERSFLLGLLTNQGTYSSEGEIPCMIGEKVSLVCAYAQGNILISLLSDKLFEAVEVNGIILGKETVLRNLSQEPHIDYYRKELGIRKYIANDKKHKFDRENTYGKGKIASRMDLREDAAQELLNKAIDINGRLYAKKDGNYYAFQNEGDINYHGCRADDLGDYIKLRLDRKFR